MEKKRNRFSEIYSDYYPVVFSAINTKVSNPEDAKDICQEVFIRLYERLDGVDNVRRWLFSALRLVVLEFYRKKKDISTDNIENVFQDVGLTFVNGFRDARIIIKEAIENTGNFKDEKERIIFELIAVNNFTYKSVSKELGITERQVRYRYQLVVERILDYLKKKGIKDLEELL